MMMDRMKEQYQRLGKDNMIAPWASHLRTDDYYDNTQGYTENLNDLMRDVGSDIWGGVKESIGGVGDTISDWWKYGFGDPENRWEGNPYELDEFEFELLHPNVDFNTVLPEERTIDTEGEDYRRLHELQDQLRNKMQLDQSMTQGLPGTEVARSRYKSEYDKAIKKLLDKGMKIKDAIIELTPQWGDQPYKGFNYKMANRGGLMSLV